MKRIAILSAALSAAAVLLSSGCESSESNDVRISPPQATVSKGASIALSAEGWNDFRWTLSDGNAGALSSTVGKTVVYTATAAGATQRITATAIGYGGASSTNASSKVSSAGYAATATIVQP